MPYPIDIQTAEPTSSAIETESNRDSEKGIVKSVKQCIEGGDVPGARELLAKIPIGVYPKVDHWRETLALPRAIQEHSATGEGVQEDTVWLQQHAGEYKGKWVALHRGVLLGSHNSLVQLHQMLKTAKKLTGTTLLHIEK
jgi:hypothetical protein